MKVVRLGVCAVLVAGLGNVAAPGSVRAASITVSPGQSIQAAVDAAPPGGTVKVLPGDYTETHGNDIAVRITKSIKLIGKSNFKKNIRVRLLPGTGNTQGIKVEPLNEGDPRVDGVKIQGFTVEGFQNNGIWLRNVNNYTIQKNESVNNLENGIWPTLSANGQVKKNVSYGSLDSALWVEASDNVRVLSNDLHHAPTGLEITISKNILAKKNNIHNNSVGVGLYHPNAAGLSNPFPTYGELVNWQILSNDIHDNNEPNSAPGGSMSAGLPPGVGILVLGTDGGIVAKNTIQNNGFFGIGVVDWCIGAALAGPEFSCVANPALTEPAPDNNQFLKNEIVGNGTAPPAGFEAFAADISGLVGLGVGNCFDGNTPTATLFGFTAPLPGC